jgi:hypothetical protein
MTNDDNDANIILRRLVRRRIYGNKHLPEPIVLSWIKDMGKHNRGLALEAYEEMLRQGIILRFRHTGETHVCVNPHKSKEIDSLLREQ